MKEPAIPQSVVEQLRRFFRRNGYVRRKNSERHRELGSRLYRKGDEVRLVAGSREELATIRQLLSRAGFKPGRPFVKGRQWRQPVYGRDEVARFLALLGETHPV
ncbi:MAG: hypothetical protein AB1486_20995 [Planctomycetota bacterium]